MLGDKPGHVPLERPRKRLVEVAKIERQLPLRGRPQPEVQEVGVATQLHRQTRVGTGREVCRHHRRRSAIEVHGDAAIRP